MHISLPFTLIAFFCGLQLFSQVTIHGTATNTKDSVIVFQKNLPNAIIRGDYTDKRYKATIKRNGAFTITLPEENIGEWVIKFGKDSFQLINLVKGQILHIQADFSKQFPLRAVGASAADFNYASYYWDAMIRNVFSNPDYQKKRNHPDYDNAIAFWKADGNDANKLLEKYHTNHRLSGPYYQWLKTKYKYEPYTSIHEEGLDSIDKKNISTRLAC